MPAIYIGKRNGFRRGPEPRFAAFCGQGRGTAPSRLGNKGTHLKTKRRNPVSFSRRALIKIGTPLRACERGRAREIIEEFSLSSTRRNLTKRGHRVIVLLMRLLRNCTATLVLWSFCATLKPRHQVVSRRARAWSSCHVVNRDGPMSVTQYGNLKYQTLESRCLHHPARAREIIEEFSLSSTRRNLTKRGHRVIVLLMRLLRNCTATLVLWSFCATLKPRHQVVSRRARAWSSCHVVNRDGPMSVTQYGNLKYQTLESRCLHHPAC